MPVQRPALEIYTGNADKLRSLSARLTQEMEGGARALALEPVEQSANCGTLSRQTTLLAWRHGAAEAAGSGVLTDAAPVLKAQQIRQLASWVCCWPPSSPVAGEWLKQISAAASGSETADANAQLAPMGARICTISAITKIGTYRFILCRIPAQPRNTISSNVGTVEAAATAD
jgi:hypothetical protein